MKVTSDTWEVYSNQIIEMRREGYSLQQIGDAVGVTRERIRQLLEEHNVPKPSFYSKEEVARLIGCSTGFMDTLRKKGVVNPKRFGLLWLHSADDMSKAQRALERYHQDHSPITLKCEQCGREFQLRPSDYRARLRSRKVSGFFCSRSCYLHYIWQPVRGVYAQDIVAEGAKLHIRRKRETSAELDYNSAIAQLWAKYGREKAKLIAKLRERYEEEARRLCEKYREQEGTAKRKED